MPLSLIMLIYAHSEAPVRRGSSCSGRVNTVPHSEFVVRIRSEEAGFFSSTFLRFLDPSILDPDDASFAVVSAPLVMSSIQSQKVSFL
jgi:hypothetical protein